MIQPLEKKESRKVIYSVLIVIGLHICWLLTSLFVRDMAIAGRMLITRTTYWLCFGVICWYAARIEKQPLLLWPEKRHPFVFYIGSVILILLVIVLIAASIALPLSRMGFKPSNLVLQILTLPLSIKLYTVITAGVLEELVFRGYIQSRLQLLFKTEYPPIFLSALFFALLHASYGTLINVLMPFIIGLIFAFHYCKYRNIKILIICHLLIDANALLHTSLPKH